MSRGRSRPGGVTPPGHHQRGWSAGERGRAWWRSLCAHPAAWAPRSRRGDGRGWRARRVESEVQAVVWRRSRRGRPCWQRGALWPRERSRPVCWGAWYSLAVCSRPPRPGWQACPRVPRASSSVCFRWRSGVRRLDGIWLLPCREPYGVERSFPRPRAGVRCPAWCPAGPWPWPWPWLRLSRPARLWLARHWLPHCQHVPVAMSVAGKPGSADCHASRVAELRFADAGQSGSSGAMSFRLTGSRSARVRSSSAWLRRVIGWAGWCASARRRGSIWRPRL
jgi:hypothetical protein